MKISGFTLVKKIAKRVIPTLKNIFSQDRYLFGLLCFSILLLILSLINRAIHIDDAWLGEQAYWLSKVGYVKSELFRGLLGYEEEQYFYHRLFIWTGALITNIFGFHLYLLKSLSLFFLIVFLISYYSFVNKHLGVNRKIVLLTISIIIIHPIVFQYSFVFRPELMLMTLGFISFIFLYRAKERLHAKYALLGGVFAGFACLTHLNGLAIAIAGFFALVLDSKFKLAVYFTVGGVVISSIYFIDLLSLKDLNSFIYQFQNDPALSNNEFGVLDYLYNLLGEHKRLFRDPKNIFFSAFVVVAVIVGYKGLKKYSFGNTFTILVIVVLATLAQSKTPKYMLVYFPFLCITISMCLEHVISKERTIKGVIVAVALLLFFFTAIFYNFHSFKENTKSIEKHEEIATNYHLNNKQIVAPMEFIFQEIGDKNIQSVKVYNFLKQRRELDGNNSFDLFGTAEYFNNSAIILKKQHFNEFNITIPEIGESRGNYTLVGVLENKFYVFQKEF